MTAVSEEQIREPAPTVKIVTHLCQTVHSHPTPARLSAPNARQLAIRVRRGFICPAAVPSAALQTLWG